ncbi:CRAL-TRIO domain-containing protein C23B6.04c [Serendipita indica DSM 11827]|uniref:Related to PDR16 protein n=1 Tax=Serendipita indica (strain DSM 11827) TaxID=1109443 RepID=G4T6V7_SERID|nr:CRAL-TRIO domain-containing protein C23B6.04c [Serendipita indica DSM 11827]CCA67050.1 related to PDR16 protein [Serendipita indica DSM 11827]
MTTEKIFEPLFPPRNSDVSRGPVKLETGQEEKRLAVLSRFANDSYTLPDSSTLMDVEKFWLTNDCLLRYLRATKWDVNAAIERIESTLKWRREFGLYDKLDAELVEPEGNTGHVLLYGYDRDMNPSLYAFPSRQVTEEGMRQIQYYTYMFEKALDATGPGVEKVSLLVNYADKSSKTSLWKAQQVLDIVQNHYPERLGHAFVINVPFIINMFFKIVMAFVDPVTKQKIHFNEDVVERGFIDKDVLISASGWGGNVDFEYKHDIYWPKLVQECNARKEEQFRRWRALGGKIGEDESVLKGSDPLPESTNQSRDAPEVVVTPPSEVH